MQDVVLVQGVPRFRENAIVRYLLDHGGIDMNRLAHLQAADEDYRQFAQLIGYSVGGYSELSYVNNASYNKAMRRVKKLTQWATP